MEFLLLQPLILALLMITISFLISRFPPNWPTHKQRKTIARSKEAPEPRGRWPVLGHLHLLGGKQTLARNLGSMADSYGPAITLWIGQRRTVVVSSWEVAKECLTVHDKALATRPFLAAGKFMGYKYAMFALAPYGPHWREAKKLATLNLLSGRQLELMKHMRALELSLGVRRLHRLWETNHRRPVKVELKEWLADLAFNTVVMMVAGKRYYGEEADGYDGAGEYKAAVESMFYLMGSLVPSDAIPCLEWLDIGGYIRAMKETERKLDSLATGWIEEHRRRRTTTGVTAGQDLIDVMLSMTDCFPATDSDPVITMKATALTVILGASDTTYVIMTWVFSLLLNNRHVLKKAQEEVDGVVGKERNVDESDIADLPYLQAIVKETLRLYPAAPVSMPHEATEDCSVGGFHVPAGTQVLFNLWKIHRDPSVWEDPSEFKPERFLSTHKDLDFRGQHFQFIPFGAGRRMCPGTSFAVQVMYLTVARLLHSFDMATQGDAAVDMTEGLGLTLPKATSLDVIVAPRLSSHLYQLHK